MLYALSASRVVLLLELGVGGGRARPFCTWGAGAPSVPRWLLAAGRAGRGRRSGNVDGDVEQDNGVAVGVQAVSAGRDGEVLVGAETDRDLTGHQAGSAAQHEQGSRAGAVVLVQLGSCAERDDGLAEPVHRVRQRAGGPLGTSGGLREQLFGQGLQVDGGAVGGGLVTGSPPHSRYRRPGADVDLLVDDADGERGHRLGRRRGQWPAGGELEARPVQEALDGAVLDVAIGERDLTVAASASRACSWPRARTRQTGRSATRTARAEPTAIWLVPTTPVQP